MIKFESYLANNNNKNESNTVIIETKTSSVPMLLWLHSPDLEKGQ